MVYFEKDGDEFPEMIAFRENFCARHQVELQVVNGNYKIGLEELKQQWGVEAIFMGTRSTDPFAPEVPFARTTSGWPNLMRVCPILYFDYSTVWEFLRALGLEYCCLYDEGFTSLGPQSTTVKNAQLVDEARGLVLPAHVLKQPQSEREGRQPTPVL
ncbi:hypothetical protein BASA81_002230 [Batrachochytrium salamandrivorans]|nr:hypothetical protein BASA81_002230 [Batrachochytrium salamandrivorans]